MTSTNDGKDVKSNQTSGQKDKTYYIGLYKSLDAQLNGECELRERCAQLCEAWRRVHTLCLHSASSTHPHLLSWIQRHTARTVLQTEWQAPNSSDLHTELEEALDCFSTECHDAIAARQQVLAWETHLLARADRFRWMLQSPWGHPVLKLILDNQGIQPTTKQVLEWLQEERGVVFAARLRQLALSKCDDLALALLTAVLDRVRLGQPPVCDFDLLNQRKDVPPVASAEQSFENVLTATAGFGEVWDLLTDMEFVLLHKSDRSARLIDLAKQTPLSNGYQLVERLLNRLETSPKEKKIWKNAKDVALLISQVMIARCMVVGQCTGAVRSVLYWCARALPRTVPPARLPRVTAALAAPAATARHLHTLATAVHAQQNTMTNDLKPFVVELYVRAITFGMNELEKLKLNKVEKEARSTEQTLASWFIQLGLLLAASARVKCECTLTAFSVHPTPAMYERIKIAPILPPVEIQETKKDDAEVSSEFGSWATDSRSMTNFVKTSETLNLNQSQHLSSVLSTAILTEGEMLGLGAELCQDIAVLLSGPRVKTLSWDMDRELLLENCRTYMERTHGGTRALTTELKYLNLDPANFQHLPEEVDDEDDLYYGIEKGYEHLVEIQEPQPEEIWEDAYNDLERTESACSSSIDEEIIVPIRRKKKYKSLPQYASDSDQDPLSIVAESKRSEKKKERPLSKERSKERKKKHKKEIKKDKKERKKKDNSTSSLSRLVGVKVNKAPEDSNMFASDDETEEKLLNSEFEDILYDGHFSMDELKSPEKPEQTPNKTLHKAVGLTIGNSEILREFVRNSNVDQKPASTKSEIQNVQASPSESKQNVQDEVKERIAKLIQFRRQKRNETHSSMSSPGESMSESPKPEMKSPPPNAINSKGSKGSLIHCDEKQSRKLTAMKNEVKNYHMKSSRPAIYYPNDLKSDLTNIDSMRKEINLPNRAAIPQSTATVNNINQANTQNEHNVSPSVPKSTSNTHLNSYQEFLKQLQWSTDEGMHVLGEATREKRKEIRPVSRVTPVVPNIVKDQTTQCAKPVNQPKKVENAPNTFSRLSYMHKNKQNDKPKKIVESSLHDSVSEELDRRIDELRKTKMKALETTTNMIYSRVSNSIATKPKELKLEVPKVENSTFTNIYASNSVLSNAITAKPKEHKVEASKEGNPTLTNISASNSITAKPKEPKVEASKEGNPTFTNTYASAPILSNLSTAKPKQPIVEASKVGNSTFTNIYASTPILSNLSNAKPKESNVEAPKIGNPTINNIYARNPVLSNLLKGKTGVTVKKANTNETQLKFIEKSQIRKPNTSLTGKDQQDILKLLGQKNMLDKTFQQTKISHTNTFMHNARAIDASGSCNTQNKALIRMINKPIGFSHTLHVGKIVHDTTKSPYPDGGPFKLPIISKSTIMKTTELIQNTRPQTKVQAKVNALQKNCTKKINIEVNKIIEAHRSVSKQYVPKPPVPIPKSNEDTTEQNWAKVLDALRSQRTPSRGPNALDMVLKKDSYEKVKERNQRFKTEDKVNTFLLSTQQAMSKPSTSANTKSISNLPVAKKLTATTKKMPSLPKKFSSSNSLIISNQIRKQPVQTELQKGNDPFISGIPNSEYEILGELMDDDLRQEIGELSSDEESYSSRSVICKSTKIANSVKNSSVIKNNIQPTSRAKTVNPGFVFDVKSRELNSPAPKAIQQKTGAKPLIISNEKVNICNLPQKVASVISTPKLQDSTCVANNHSSVLQKVATLANKTSNALYNPPVQNMVVFDPYTGMYDLNQSYIDSSVITVYQQQYTPVANPVIINNTFTLSVNTVPLNTMPVNTMSGDTMPVTSSVMYENSQTLTSNVQITDPINAPAPCIKQTELIDPILSNQVRTLSTDIYKNDRQYPKTRELKTCPVDSKPKMDNNLNKTCERKVLSEVQEKLTIPTFSPEKIPKNRTQRLSLENEKVIDVKNQERLTNKRLAIINRDINHRCYYPPIPLTYTPLKIKVVKTKENTTQTDTNGNVKKDTEKSVEDKSHGINLLKDADSNANDNSKENKHITTTRRILLRSSNKLRANELTPLNNEGPVGRKTKVRLKVSVNNSDLTKSNIETLTKSDQEKKCTELDKSKITEAKTEVTTRSKDIKIDTPIRISKRILNKKIKQSRNEEAASQNLQIEESKIKKTEIIVNAEDKPEYVIPNNNTLDIEDAITGAKIPKALNKAVVLMTATDIKIAKTEISSNTEKERLHTLAEHDIKTKNLIQSERDSIGSKDDIVKIQSSPEILEIDPLTKFVPELIARVKNDTSSATYSIKIPHMEAINTSYKIDILDPAELNDDKSKPHTTQEKIMIVESPSKKIDVHNKLSKLVSDMESAINAITETTVNSPLIEVEIINTSVKHNEPKQNKIDCGSKTTDITNFNKGNNSDRTLNNIDNVNKSIEVLKIDNAEISSQEFLHTDQNIGIEDSKISQSKNDYNDIYSITKKDNYKSEKDKICEVLSENAVEKTNVHKFQNIENENNTELQFEKDFDVPLVSNATEKISILEDRNKEIKQLCVPLSEIDSHSVTNKDSLVSEKDKVCYVPSASNAAENTNVHKNQNNEIKNPNDSLSEKDLHLGTDKRNLMPKKYEVCDLPSANNAAKNTNVQIDHNNEIKNSDELLPKKVSHPTTNIAEMDKVCYASSPRMAGEKTLGKEGNNQRDNKLLKPTIQASAIHSMEIPQSYKDSIHIEEIAIPGNTNPLKRCVRVVLPHKTYIATVSGKMQVSFDTIFDDPKMKNILLSSMSKKKRCTLNLQQLTSPDSKIVDIKVNEIQVQSSDLSKTIISENVETVNLISDDEDDVSQSFKTECGSFKVKDMDFNTYEKHQKKFSQKCSIKLKRCDEKLKSDILVNALIKDSSNSLEPAGHIEPNIVPDVIEINPAVTTEPMIVPDIIEIDLAASIEPMIVPDVIEIDPAIPFEPMIVPDVIEIDPSIRIEPKTVPDVKGIDPAKRVESKIVPDVIEIDDSSDEDGPSSKKQKKIDELKKLLLKDLGVANNILEKSAQSVDQQKDRKSQFDFSVGSSASKCHINFKKKNTSQSETILLPSQPKRPDSVSSKSKRSSKTVSNLLKKHDKSKIITKKCYVKLVKCDNIVRKYQHADNIETDCNADTTGTLSRSNSFSLLNNLEDDVEVLILQDVSTPVNRSSMNSPVMEAFNMIATLKDSFKDKELAQKYNNGTTCASDWFATKYNLHLQALVHINNSEYNKIDMSTDYETGLSDVTVSDLENTTEGQPAKIPSLITLMSKYFEDNPLVTRLTPISEQKRNSLVSLKRKLSIDYEPTTNFKSNMSVKLNCIGLSQNEITNIIKDNLKPQNNNTVLEYTNGIVQDHQDIVMPVSFLVQNGDEVLNNIVPKSSAISKCNSKTNPLNNEVTDCIQDSSKQVSENVKYQTESQVIAINIEENSIPALDLNEVEVTRSEPIMAIKTSYTVPKEHKTTEIQQPFNECFSASLQQCTTAESFSECRLREEDRDNESEQTVDDGILKELNESVITAKIKDVLPQDSRKEIYSECISSDIEEETKIFVADETVKETLYERNVETKDCMTIDSFNDIEYDVGSPSIISENAALILDLTTDNVQESDTNLKLPISPTLVSNTTVISEEEIKCDSFANTESDSELSDHVTETTPPVTERNLIQQVQISRNINPNAMPKLGDLILNAKATPGEQNQCDSVSNDKPDIEVNENVTVTDQPEPDQSTVKITPDKTQQTNVDSDLSESKEHESSTEVVGLHQDKINYNTVGNTEYSAEVTDALTKIAPLVMEDIHSQLSQIVIKITPDINEQVGVDPEFPELNEPEYNSEISHENEINCNTGQNTKSSAVDYVTKIILPVTENNTTQPKQIALIINSDNTEQSYVDYHLSKLKEHESRFKRLREDDFNQDSVSSIESDFKLSGTVTDIIPPVIESNKAQLDQSGININPDNVQESDVDFDFPISKELSSSTKTLFKDEINYDSVSNIKSLANVCDIVTEVMHAVTKNNGAPNNAQESDVDPELSQSTELESRTEKFREEETDNDLVSNSVSTTKLTYVLTEIIPPMTENTQFHLDQIRLENKKDEPELPESKVLDSCIKGVRNEEIECDAVLSTQSSSKKIHLVTDIIVFAPKEDTELNCETDQDRTQNKDVKLTPVDLKHLEETTSTNCGQNNSGQKSNLEKDAFKVSSFDEYIINANENLPLDSFDTKQDKIESSQYLNVKGVPETDILSKQIEFIQGNPNTEHHNTQEPISDQYNTTIKVQNSETRECAETKDLNVENIIDSFKHIQDRNNTCMIKTDTIFDDNIENTLVLASLSDDWVALETVIGSENESDKSIEEINLPISEKETKLVQCEIATKSDNNKLVQTDMQDNNKFVFATTEKLKTTSNEETQSIDSSPLSVTNEQTTFTEVSDSYICETKVLVEEVKILYNDVPSEETINIRIENSTLEDSVKSDDTLVAKTAQEVECSENILEKNVTILYKDDSGVILKGIEYEGPEIGSCYVLPLEKSCENVSENSIEITEKVDNNIDYETNLPEEIAVEHENTNLDYDVNLEVIVPKFTYSKHSLKRKADMRDIDFNEKRRRGSKSRDSSEGKTLEKKYRKGKNIDTSRLTPLSIAESSYAKDYKRLLDYYSTIGFSYSVAYSIDTIDVYKLVKKWPIEGSVNHDSKDKYDECCTLFTDLEPDEKLPDPLTLTLVEEISAEYNEDYSSKSKIEELNFNMGFGEGSGRVNQNLNGGAISKFSAVTLSDVKQSQPFLLSGNDYENNFLITTKQNQLETIKRFYTNIQLRDKVRSYFKNTTIELERELYKEELKDSADYERGASFPFFKYIPKHVEPRPITSIVQVVQVGQLPVSAAAQNPVTCDPRVTQVSDASPSQCSVENSPHDDSQQGIKNEYTELTTADLSLPLVEDYVQHNHVVPMESQESTNISNENIPIQTEMVKTEVKIEIEEESPDDKDKSVENTETEINNHNMNNIEYLYDTNNGNAVDNDIQAFFSTEKPNTPEAISHQKPQNGSSEKTDQIAHAMNAAGITTTSETVTNTRAHALVNILSQKIRHSGVNANQNSSNNYPKTTSINAMALQQALAQILPPPLNQTNVTENNHQGQNVTPQVLHIVQGKNASGNQITLVDNTQQSVISGSNTTPVLHIVQNKAGTPGPTSNGSPAQQSNTFSGLSLVDAGLQQGGNQLLHIVNTGNQKNNNAGQLLKRVNLLTNLTNVQGSNEQKMVQFVCKSADGKAIQLNAPHQRSMVLRLQPIETPNMQVTQPKPVENQDLSPTQNAINAANKESVNTQEIKSRSVYEENYAKFIQNSSNKPTVLEKSTSLPKFNQAFGKTVFQDGNQKQNEMNSNNITSVSTTADNSECQAADNSINLDHIGQISSPPLLLRKSPAQTSQAQTNLVQQIKQTIAPVNIQTMHGGVIYTRQIPVNIGGGQTINLITVPSTELIDDSGQKQVNQGEMEPSIIKIVPQSQGPPNAEVSTDDMNVTGDNTQNPPQPQPVLTQMRIKLPMLSKTPQMVSGARVVRPSFFQIQRNVIGGANQPVYQQLVLTAAPPLGQQTIRLPQAQARQIKVPENQSSESQMSSSTLEQLREFDMVLEQVKERSTVQPNSNSGSSFKLHTTSTDTTDSPAAATSTSAETTQVLYSIGSNQPLSVAYVNRKSTLTTPTTTTFVRSPDSSGIADSPTSSTHVQLPHTVTTEASSNESTSTQQKPVKVSSKSKSRPKSSSNPPSSMKINTVPPKTSAQKPLEDEQTTQRILYILAEYKEQVENSPDKDKPAPRRRSNPPSNPSGSSKRKKSSSGSRRPGARDLSPVHGDDTCRTMGSEDSSCGTSQGDCNESCLESHSPQDSPRKVVRKLTFEQDPTVTPPRPQQQRNVIVADGQTITVARGTAGKPATAVLMPANYILPVSMVKGGQQIAIVTNRGPKLLTVGGGEGGATNALLLQRLIGPAGLKPVLTRPGVRHVRLPTAALHNLQAFNLTTATTVQPPDSTASPAPDPNPPELVETRAETSPWADRESEAAKPERASSPDESEPWNLPSSADPHDYTYEETVRAENINRTVLDPIPDRYSPDMEAQRIFDKMFDVDTKKSYIVDSQVDSPRCAYDIDQSDCDDKPYQVVQKKDVTSHRQTRLAHVSAAALRHKYAILEHELRLQKSLSEECEDLGVDSPSASELFPEAELLFAASPAQDHAPDTPQHSHTPQPTLLNQSTIQADIDDQIATDQLLPRENIPDRQDLDVNLGLGDVGIVTVSEDGMQATVALDQEEFARAHPNTTFHSEPTDEEVVQPFTISGLKSRHITSTIFDSARAPATVLMSAAAVISQPPDAPAHSAKYDIDNIINIPNTHTNNINLSSVLVKDDGLTRFDNILTDSRELHLSNNTAIVHSAGNAAQVIRRVCYDDDKRERFLMDEPDALIAGDDAKMIAEDSSRDATMESMGGDVDDGNSSPERHAELFWESNSASERSESRRPLDFSSDSEKCCKSPSYDETNSTDSSGVGTNMRLDSVIKEARGVERSASAGSSADDTHPPLRTYPPKRLYHSLEGELERSLSGKTRAGERSPDSLEVRRRASGRGVVKRGCHCCNGSPVPPRPKKPRQRKPTMDFTSN